MIILKDMDDTTFNWAFWYDNDLDEKYPELTGIPRTKDRLSFDLWSGRTEEERAAILSVMDAEGFYERLEPLEGAVDAYHEMIAEGHQVFFCSSPWYSNRTCLDDKARSIAKHYGDDALDNLILTKKKWMINGDILFDDKANIEGAEKANWSQVLFDGPHNQDSTLPRIRHWSEWRTAVANVALAKLGEPTFSRLSLPTFHV